MITITPQSAIDLIMPVLKARKVPMLHGSPGTGKSAIYKTLAKRNNLKLIDLRLSQCDPSDLMGFPAIDKEKKTAGYVPMDFFPIEGTPIPAGFKGWMLLLDEFNSAPRAVEAAAYRLVLDREVGQHKLHENVVCVAAGNLQTDGAIVNKLSTASQSRMIHFVIHTEVEAWCEWGVENGIDHRIVAFIRFRNELLHKFDPRHNDMTFPCPRTWEFMSDILKHIPTLESKHVAIMAGTISEGPAREFYEFTHIYTTLPTLQQILANPEGIALSSEPSVNYAITGMLSGSMSVANAEQMFKYITRMNVEFQFITLSSAIRINKKLLSVPMLSKWAIKTAKDLI